MQKNKLLVLLVVWFALVFVGVSLAQEGDPLPPPPPPDSFFDVFVDIELPEDWSGALYGEDSPVHVRPFSPAEWDDYMEQWMNPDFVEGDPYPMNKFMPAELYVWDGPVPDLPEAGPGLVMAWGNEDLPDGSFSSAWKMSWGEDPDLTNCTIQITVVPPPHINAVSFGMRDVNGNIRAWYWNVGPAPAPIPWNVPTTVTINTAVVGVGATNPMASSYTSNPGFDITQVLDFIVDENAVWQQPSQSVPPPGQVIQKPWNLWENLIVKPNSGNRLNVGINIDIHQDLNNPQSAGFDPALDPDDFHVEGRVESGLPLGAPGGGGWSDPPVLVDHFDGLLPYVFPNFSYSITPDYGDPGENWYIFRADWSGMPIPWCNKIHLGVKFDVVCHNVIIDLVGWWTLGGNPYPAGGADQGQIPIPGFNVQDNILPEVMPERPRQSMRLSYEGPLPPRITKLDVAVMDAETAKQILGERPLQELYEEGAQIRLPYVEIMRGDMPISDNNPLDFHIDSFFDVFFDIELPAEIHPPMTMTINPGDILVARQEVEYPNSEGTMESHWMWEIHEAHSLESELGDAPDSTNSFNNAPMTAYPWGTPANFPTVFRLGSPPFGPIHWFPHQVAFLGRNVTVEQEADLPPDQDPTTNLIPLRNLADLDKADDGLVNFPLKLPNCLPTSFKYQVNLVNPIQGQPLYFNAWLDMDHDGDWTDPVTGPAQCPQGPAPEWIVQDQDVSMFLTGVSGSWPAPGLYTVKTPPFLANLSNSIAGAIVDPYKTPVWLRISLTETPWQGSSVTGGPPYDGGSGPANGYKFGETEDYIFVPWKACCYDCPDFNADGVINLIDFAHFVSLWLKNCN